MNLPSPQALHPRRWSIRWRLTLLYVVSVLTILTLAGLIVFEGFRAELIAQTDRSLTIKGAEIVAQITGGERLKPYDTYTPPRLSLDQIDARARLAMSAPSFDASGDPIYERLTTGLNAQPVAISGNLAPHGKIENLLRQTLAETPQKEVTGVFAGVAGENLLRVVTFRIPSTTYVLQLATPWRRNADALAPTANIIVGVVLFCVAVTGYGGWLLVRRTLQPIEEIVAEAERRKGDRLEPDFVAARTFADDEIGRLVHALNDMMARLQHSVAMQRQFTADASHDLRTPLTILRGEVEFALSRERSGGEYRETLASVLEEIERLTSIVSDIIELARSDSPDYKNTRVRFEPIDLYRLCRDMIESRTGYAEMAGVTICNETGERAENGEIKGDRQSLERALTNLIDNAIEYNRPGGSVIVKTEIEEAQVKIAVTDTGIGVAPEDLPRIFERFYRVDKARSAIAAIPQKRSSRSGLGLAIVKAIVTAHGGTIDAKSEIGNGTSIQVTLPRA